MGVIFPISIPAAYALGPTNTALMISTIAATIAGSNAGDNCSPFSDTTILSAALSGISVMSHTKSQFPFAIIALLVALVVGYIPVGFQLYNQWVANALSMLILTGIVLGFGTYTGSFSKQQVFAAPEVNPILMVRLARFVRSKLCRRVRKREEYETI